MFRGYVSGYVSRYVSQCWALDEMDVVGVCIGVCIEVRIGLCIGGVKHAPFHEFLTRHFWKQPCIDREEEGERGREREREKRKSHFEIL